MFKKVYWRSTLFFAGIAALLFCIGVFAYIRAANYNKTWLLYMGSFLFEAVIWVYILTENRRRGQNESTVALVFASHVTTVVGILASCFISFLLLSFFVPGYLHSGMATKVLVNEPANFIVDKTQGLSFQVFFAATIINFSVGSFSSIVLPFYVKKNQKKDYRRPTPLKQ